MGLFSKKKVDSQIPKTSDFNNVNASTTNNNLDNNSTKAFLTAEFDESHVTHFQPKSYEDVGNIADVLMRFDEVTVSLKAIETKEEKRRIIDFLSGFLYSQQGSYKKVENGIFRFMIPKKWSS